MDIQRLISVLGIGGVALIVVLIVINSTFSAYIKRRHQEDAEFDATLVYFSKRVVEFLVWMIATLMILQNLGVQISALIGGLGISGIAVAFAVQNVLKDIFSSFSIYFDRPFKLGDWIQVGKDSGKVHKIGLKSTRLITLQGEELIISNKELTDSRVINSRRVTKRRVAFSFTVSYQTPAAKAAELPEQIKTVISKQSPAEFSRAHLKSLGDAGLVFEVVYFLPTDDYAVYMDVQQAINLELLSLCNKQKLVFVPSQPVVSAS